MAIDGLELGSLDAHSDRHFGGNGLTTRETRFPPLMVESDSHEVYQCRPNHAFDKLAQFELPLRVLLNHYQIASLPCEMRGTGTSGVVQHLLGHYHHGKVF